jgi:ketosteroid isomerase-like protein
LNRTCGEGDEIPTKLESVKAFYAAFARGDVQAGFELLDPDVEWLTPETLPWSRGDYHGRDEVAQYFAGLGEAVEDVSVEPDDLLTCGENVIALGLYRGRSSVTGRSFAARFAHVLTVRDGRVIIMRGYEDTATIAAAFE